TFSKGGAPIKKVADINKLIKESAIFSTRGAKAKCSFELQENLWLSEVDEGQINQVIGNLVINANQAMPNGGTIKIRTENENIDTENWLHISAGRYIKIIVEDQGVGISEKSLPNIFDPYFTTKQKGSGLGLATTYSIIKRHGGHITVHSETEKGTIFNVYLPAASIVLKKIADKAEVKHKGKGKILIMDDQKPILKMFDRIISRMGYDTVSATDGSQAVELYRDAYQSGNPFDLVILDLTVPGGMGGAKTILELLKIDTKVKAVVSSGYSNDPIMANYEDYGFCGVIPKPYTKDQMTELLYRIFGEKE
ncbi:MAG: response regulator, partial [Desulfobacteraceae bacterium]|nr:response regulator [Desulfobacteraceae bacterium]